MKDENTLLNYPSHILRRVPPTWLAVTTAAFATGLVILVQFIILRDKNYGLAYSLPALLCLWNRNRVILYTIAVAGTLLTAIKLLVILPDTRPNDNQLQGINLLFISINLWTIIIAIHVAIIRGNRVAEKTMELADANLDLEAANRELATREEEVVSQNQELQAQSEELERQAEELRQQAEELEQQTVELHAANDELTRRERGLQTLLESARWLRSDLSEGDVMSAVCQAAVQVMEEGVSAAAVVYAKAGKLALRGHYGFGVHGALREEIPFTSTFAALVMERGQTAYIADASSRPDLILPQPASGRLFRSLLATPLTIEGKIIGAVEVYAQQPREWTDGEFKVIEWLAAQCALALQAIEYQQEVLVKRREAEEASVQKTRFLAAISHDVRTPANAISLMADIIEQSAADPTAHAELPGLAKDLKANAKALVDLVSDVLDLTRLDTGKLDLQTTDFPLLPLLQNELRQFEHIAAEKKLRLTLHPLPAAHAAADGHAPDDIHLRTDRMKLARVVANLLGNAVKFTEAGAVDLRVLFLPNGSLGIKVSDTGVGIPKDALPRIFDEFYQLQNPERDRNKGAGLGLAICKRLIDALGCSLTVESSPGIGTTFTIVLPATLLAGHTLAVSPPPAPTAWGRDTQNRPILADIKILLVEDHDVTRRATSRLLTAAGAAVLEARTAREALHLLTHESPTVLLLDLMLPDADGSDILRHLKNNRPKSLTRVLAVSGDVRDARVAEVKELGADDLLAKPLNIQKLLGAILGVAEPT